MPTVNVYAEHHELVDGNTNKFYRIYGLVDTSPGHVIRQWGRRGTDGQWQQGTSRDPYDDIREESRRRQQRGYKEIHYGHFAIDLADKTPEDLYLYIRQLPKPVKTALSGRHDAAWTARVLGRQQPDPVPAIIWLPDYEMTVKTRPAAGPALRRAEPETPDHQHGTGNLVCQILRGANLVVAAWTTGAYDPHHSQPAVLPLKKYIPVDHQLLDLIANLYQPYTSGPLSDIAVAYQTAQHILNPNTPKPN